jgi:hypothetical protein
MATSHQATSSQRRSRRGRASARGRPDAARVAFKVAGREIGHPHGHFANDVWTRLFEQRRVDSYPAQSRDHPLAHRCP